jgi:hypothetical protein
MFSVAIASAWHGVYSRLIDFMRSATIERRL